jgi:hypothetical protein
MQILWSAADMVCLGNFALKNSHLHEFASQSPRDELGQNKDASDSHIAGCKFMAVLIYV